MSWRFVKKLQDAQDGSVDQHDHRDAMACPAPGTWWELWPAGPAAGPGRNPRNPNILTMTADPSCYELTMIPFKCCAPELPPTKSLEE